jgi:hypothetical protein
MAVIFAAPMPEFAGYLFTPLASDVALPADKQRGNFKFIFQNKSQTTATGAGPFADPMGTPGMRLRATYDHSIVR